jgi:hypothetical protein
MQVSVIEWFNFSWEASDQVFKFSKQTPNT